MKTIGIFTQNFSVFYDAVRLLKDRNVEFFSLNSGRVPPWIQVVLTTPESREAIRFRNVVVLHEGRIEEGVERAILMLNEKKRYSSLVVGIDPGEKPGIAVYGDNMLLTTAKVELPEVCEAMLKRVMRLYSAKAVTVRVGNGAPIFRNRIINALLSLPVKIEVVDEHGTTEKNRHPDINAAKKIGLKKGKVVDMKMDITPTDGELNNIQRRSRLMSNGRFTISRESAEEVAVGILTLQEAVKRTEKELFGKVGHN